MADSRSITFQALLALGLLLTGPANAQGFDFFGLFGSSEPAPPHPSADAISYTVDVAGLAEHKDLDSLVKDASNAWKLRQEPPPTGAGLAQRVYADFPRLSAALQASGYYDGALEVRVAGVVVRPDGTGLEAAAAAAEKYRNADLAPVRIAVIPGAPYPLRRISVYDARTGKPVDRTLFSKRSFEYDDKAPARAATLVGLQTQWLDELRGKSYPLARIKATSARVDHNAHAVDASVTLDTGPRAGIGRLNVNTPPGIHEEIIRSYMYVEEGEDYSPEKLAAIRKSIARIEAVGSVRVEDGDKLDAKGNLPILVSVDARKEHAVGASAQYSTVDGPSLRAYWVDRNLFGGAERLRIDALAGFAPLSTGGLGSLGTKDVIGGLKASFLKPALGGTRNDLLLDASLMREKNDYYRAAFGNVSAQVRHRFDDRFSIQGGVLAERGHWDDVFGGHDYSLLGAPMSVAYDSTDVPLAPTEGVRATLTTTPYAKFLPQSVGMIVTKGQASAYKAIDPDGRYVMAGRIAAGSIVGQTIQDVPASLRFFAGGGGSVRGYAYRSLSPVGPTGTYVGGRSLFEASAEARIKITDTIGVVPFVDVGQAFNASYPDFSAPVRAAAGLGLRYYTGIGPVRIDLATPLNPPKGAAHFAVTIGIGEAF